MIKNKKILPLFCMVLTLAALFLTAKLPLHAASDGRELRIVFTHDTHSHINSFHTLVDGNSLELGGFSRIKTLIDREKEKNPNTLVLDAGDFSMGTLAQTIFSSDSPELRMLGAIGCDVATLGNHEFDYRTSGLVEALKAATDSGDPLPALVLSNIDWATMEQAGLTEEQKALKEAFTDYGMKDYIVLERNSLRIAVFGIFGKDSLACAPTCVLTFRDPIQAAADTVAEIKSREAVDMIICISHSGTSGNPSKSEDELLAKAVPEIDFIVSGHSHTTLEQAIRQGDTYIGSAGEYGRHIGSVSMKQRADGRWDMTEYTLIPVTMDIPPDAPTQALADTFMETVDALYLSSFGYTRQQILAQNTIAFATANDLYTEHKEYNLGNLLSDSFRYAASLDSRDLRPVDLAIVPTGCIRDSFRPGEITVEDVFSVYSLGTGPDQVTGYPLISLYLTAEELKIAGEIDATVSDLMNSARLHMSGMNFEFNPHRLPFNRVTDIYLTDAQGSRREIEDGRLYRVICDLYSGQMLGAVTDLSRGLIKLQPKFEDGTPIENIEDAILYSEGRELKAWAAIAAYLETLEDSDDDGIPNIPGIYSCGQGRIVVNHSTNILEILRSPNKYSIAILVILLLLLSLLILLVTLVFKGIRKCLRYRNKNA